MQNSSQCLLCSLYKEPEEQHQTLHTLKTEPVIYSGESLQMLWKHPIGLWTESLFFIAYSCE